MAFATEVITAQDINNGGFENWQNLGTDNVEPTNWNSFMTADGNIITNAGKAKRVDRVTDKRPGSIGNYSAVIWSTSTLGVIANGNLTTGKINMGSAIPSNSNNYNFTKRSDANFNHPFIGHPDSLVLWVKFKPASNGSEQARVHAVLHDNAYDVRDPADGTSTTHIAGDATLNFTKTNGLWVRKSIPFIYSTSVTPAYILVSLTTNMTPGGGSAGDSLYIDDMMTIFNPVLTTGTISPTTYIVDAGNGAVISIPFTLTGTMYADNIVTAQLSDASGSFASPVVLGTLNTTTSGTINGMIPAGTTTGGGYRIRVVSSNYAITAADNGNDIVISDVTDIFDNPSENNHVYFSENALIADLQQASFNSPHIQLFDVTGRMIAGFELLTNSMNRVELNIPSGIYMYRLSDGNKTNTGKIVKL